MAAPIFFDVLPKFGYAAFEAGMAKFKSAAAEGGKEVGLALSTGTDGALKRIQVAYTEAANAAVEASRLQVRATQQVEIATVRLSEVTTKYGESSSYALRAALAESDAKYRLAAANTAVAETQAAAATATAGLATATAGTSTAMLATGRALNTVGAVSAVAFTAAMFESGKAAGHFEQLITKLGAAADETKENLKVISDGTLKMAGDVGYSANELADAMYGIEKQSFRGADGLKVLKAAAQLAKIENVDLKEGVQGLTVSMHDFGYAADKAADVASKMKVAAGESGGTLQEFSGALHSVEPAAAAAGIKMEDVYTTLSMMTKSGMSADQAAQNMNNAIGTLANSPNVKGVRDAMAQFGISADDVSQKLGQRGLVGTMQMLSESVASKITEGTNVSVSALVQNGQAAETAAEMMQHMSPAAASLSQALANHAIGVKEYIVEARKSNIEDKARMTSFAALETRLNDFSKQFKNGTSLTETYNSALKQMLGTIPAMSTALQVTGMHAGDANALLEKLFHTTADGKGDVQGTADIQETFNKRLADAKAAFGAAGIALGTDFLPYLKDLADGLKTAGQYLAEHKGVLEAVTLAVGGLGGAWLITKTAMAIGSLVSAIGTGMAAIGGFVWGLAGKYDALAVSANAAATAEARAAAGGGAGAFAAGGAGGAALRAGGAGAAARFIPGVGYVIGAYELGQNNPANTGHYSDGKLLPGSVLGPDGKPDLQASIDALPGGKNANPTGYGPNNQSVSVDTLSRLHGDTVPPPDGAPVPPPSDALPPDWAARPDVTNPANLTPEQLAANAKAAKAPAGDKSDPIWIASTALDKVGKEGKDVYNPFAQFQTQGFTPASVVGLLTTWALNQALGNPYGKLAAQSKLGADPSNPMYVSNVDVDAAQKDYAQAVHQYGPDSEQAQKAAVKLQATQAAVGTTGGYYNPVTGGFSAHDPGVGYGAAAVGAGGGMTAEQNAVAAAIIQEGQRRGLSREQIIAGLDVARLESNYGANPASRGAQNQSGTIVKGIFQQDTGYTGDHNDPHNAAGQYFDRFIQRGGLGTDPYTGAVRVQVGQYGPDYVRSQNQGGVYDRLTAAPPPPPAPPKPTPLVGPAGVGTGGDGAALPSLADLFPGSEGFGGGRGIGGFGGLGSAPPPIPLPQPGGGLTIGEAGKGRPVFNWPAGAYGPRGPIGGAATGVGGPRGAQPVPGSALAIGGVNGAGLSHIPGANLALGGVGGKSPQPGGGRPYGAGESGKGFGVGGGAIGMAESAASMLAGPAAPAAQAATQLVNRAIGYVGQLAGIGISGLFETFGLNDSPLADPGKSLIGRIAGGFAGAHKSGDNVAGQTQPPLKPPDPNSEHSQGMVNSGPGSGAGVYIENLHNNGNPGDGQSVAKDIDRKLSSASVGQTRGPR